MFEIIVKYAFMLMLAIEIAALAVFLAIIFAPYPTTSVSAPSPAADFYDASTIQREI